MAENLAQAGKIKGTPAEWLKDTFIPQLTQLSARLLRSVHGKFSQEPGYYGVFGMDVLVSDEAETWFSEMNFSPELGLPNSCPWKRQTQLEMLTEVMGIQDAVLQYRMARALRAKDPEWKPSAPAAAGDSEPPRLHAADPDTQLIDLIRPKLKRFSPMAYVREPLKEGAEPQEWWYHMHAATGADDREL